MPYKNEYAKHQTIVDLVNSQKVNNFMDKMKIVKKGKSHFEKVDTFIFEENNTELLEEERLNFVFAFDGSKTNISLHTGYPGAEVGLLKISQCFIQLGLMSDYQKAQFPHPQDYDNIFINQSFEITVPGYNVGSDDYPEPKDFFRYSIFNYLEENHNTFADVLINKSSDAKAFKPKTFLDTYVDLLIRRPHAIKCAHPCPECRSRSVSLSLNEFKTDNLFDNGVSLNYKIKCHCLENQRDIFITDFLRFHEGFNSSGSNDGIYSQVMSFMEKIIFMNLIHMLEEFFSYEDINPIFKDCAFILDGPLSLFNYSAWFSQAIYEELIRINESNSLLVIGVEKTGNFVEHLLDLDSVYDENDNALNNGMLFFLNDNYIKKYIQLSSSNEPYGYSAYFGKKLFYKNYKDDLFVINYAYSSHDDKEKFLNDKNSAEYLLLQPRIRDLVWIFEKFSSSRFKNALSFVSMAHENASISSGLLGKKVIENFVKSKIKLD